MDGSILTVLLILAATIVLLVVDIIRLDLVAILLRWVSQPFFRLSCFRFHGSGKSPHLTCRSTVP
jgi:hypothetical protein